MIAERRAFAAFFEQPGQGQDDQNGQNAPDHRRAFLKTWGSGFGLVAVFFAGRAFFGARGRVVKRPESESGQQKNAERIKRHIVHAFDPAQSRAECLQPRLLPPAPALKREPAGR